MRKIRLLSLLLSVCLVLGLFAAPAQAITFTNDPSKLVDEAQYIIGGIPRSGSFATAWNAVMDSPSGGTVKLTRSVTAAGGSFGSGSGFTSGGPYVPAGKSVTLDLNGCTLDRGGAGGSVLSVLGTLTLTDSKGGGKIKGGSGQQGGGVFVRGRLEMQGGSIAENTAASGGGIYNAGTVVLAGGSITNNVGGGLYQTGTLSVSGAPRVADNTMPTGEKRNVYLFSGRMITVGGALANGAQLGVTAQETPSESKSVAVASGVLTTADPARFPSDAGLITALEKSKIVLRSRPQVQTASMPVQQPAASVQPTAQSQQAAQPAAASVQPQADETFTVTFNENGGTMLYPSQKTRKITVTGGNNSAPVGPLPLASNEGHRFDGWFTEQTGGTKVESTTPVTGDVTYYAHWTPVQCNVNFNLNTTDNLETINSQVKTFGKKYKEPDSLPSVAKYTEKDFLGWSLDPDGKQLITDESTVLTAHDHTLFAIWNENNSKCEVIFQPSKTSNDSYSLVAEKGSELQLPTAGECGFAAPEGQGFSKWRLEVDNTPHNAGASYTIPANAGGTIKFIAEWTDSYTVTFSPNGGTLDVDKTTKQVTLNAEYGELPTPTHADTSKTFVGWFLGEDGGKQIEADDIVTIASDHTLYAVWDSADEYQITFKPGTGTGEDIVFITKDKKLTLPTAENCGFGAPEGQMFDGWKIGSGTTAQDTVAGVSCNFDGDTDVTAQWREIRSFEVTFHEENGAANQTTIIYYEGEKLGERWYTPEWENHHFEGWYDAQTGGNKAGPESVVGGISTFYAHWTEETANTCTITFNPNDGTWSDNTTGIKEQVCEICQEVDLAYGEDDLSREGYEFMGWREGDSETVIAGKGKYTPQDAAVTLNAVWRAKTCTVTFDAVDGVFNTKKSVEVTQTYGAKYKLPNADPTYDDHTFAGWFTERDGGTAVTAQTDMLNAAPHTLYAHWEPVTTKTITVTLDPNGGSWADPDATKTVTITLSDGVTYPIGGIDDPTTPSAKDYTFAGWCLVDGDPMESTSDDYGVRETPGKIITADTPVTLKKDHTLYAAWRGGQTGRIVTFKPNIDSDEKSEFFTDYSGKLTLPELADCDFAAPADKSFKGWTVTELKDIPSAYYAIGSIRVPDEEYTFGRNQNVVIARWEPEDVYTVTLNPNGGTLPEDAPNTIQVVCNGYYSSEENPLPVPVRDGYVFAGWRREWQEEGANSDIVNRSEFVEPPFMSGYRQVERLGDHELKAYWTAVPDDEAEYIPNGQTAATDSGDFEDMWKKAVTAKKGTVRLLKDIKAENGSFGSGDGFADGRVGVPSGAVLTLDLNGHTLDRGLTANSEKQGPVIGITGTLTLEDSSDAKTGKITGGYNKTDNGGGIRVGASAELRMYGGTISGNTALNGGGIYNYQGACYLYGGTITNNRAYGDMADAEVAKLGNAEKGVIASGGGVYNHGAQFNLSAVTISNNSAYLLSSANTPQCKALSGVGGGLYSDASVDMSDNTVISGNTVRVTANTAGISGRGAGVYCNSSFLMKGGTITGNKTSDTLLAMGGGVAIGANGNFTMRGGDIKNNSGYNGGGGVLNMGQFTMNYGDISGNSSLGNLSYGAGVYNYDGDNSNPVFVMTGGRILNNTADSQGIGGVAYPGVQETDGSKAPRKFTVSGQAIITGNKAGAQYCNVPAGPNALIFIGDTDQDNDKTGFYPLASIGVRYNRDTPLANGETYRFAFDEKDRNEENVKQFFSDNPRYMVAIDDEDPRYLVLKNGELVSVTLDANGGTVNGKPTDTVQVARGNRYTPPNPVRSGYTFAGWYTEAEGGDKIDMPFLVEKDIDTWYAQWTKNEEPKKPKITLNANGGKFDDDTTEKEIEPGDPLPTPERDGYEFEYWCDENCDPVTDTSEITEDTTLRARWKEKKPDNPDNPNPDNPDDPKPDNPDNPDDPKPDNPDKPDKPDKPSSGGSSGGSGGGSGSSSSSLIITASTSPGGTISPIGRVRVSRGSDRTFTMTPQSGYVISDVLVDDVSVGARSSYTFEDIRRSHTIRVIYAQSDTAATPAPVQLPSTTQPSYTAGSSAYYSCPKDATCPIAPYTDAQPIAWYHDGVHYCIDNGLMTGTGDSHFEPTTPLSRGMLAQILYNRAGKPIPSGSGFSDLVRGAWYEDAVRYAAETGLVAGYENGNYGPSDAITREQLVVVLWRHAGSPSSAVDVPFSDFGATHGYARDAVRWAYGRGILSGKEGNRLDPAGKASRAEVAQMLKSYFDSGM